MTWHANCGSWSMVIARFPALIDHGCKGAARFGARSRNPCSAPRTRANPASAGAPQNAGACVVARGGAQAGSTFAGVRNRRSPSVHHHRSYDRNLAVLIVLLCAAQIPSKVCADESVTEGRPLVLEPQRSVPAGLTVLESAKLPPADPAWKQGSRSLLTTGIGMLVAGLAIAGGGHRPPRYGSDAAASGQRDLRRPRRAWDHHRSRRRRDLFDWRCPDRRGAIPDALP